MTKWMLAASAAALAMTGPALAEKGGTGHDRGKGGQAKVERGDGGKARAQAQGERRQKLVEQREKRRDVARDRREARVEMAENRRERIRDARDERREKVRENRADRNEAVREARAERREKIREYRADRNEAIREARAERRDNIRDMRERREERLDWRRGDDVRFAPRWDNRGLVRYDGCPPGLAKKGNGCMPPGHAKKIVGTTVSSALASRVLSGPYRDWYRDNDRYLYRWDDDYIYRVNRNGGLIDALFPYANRDYYYYPVGYQYPQSYNYYNVPYQYRSYYPDNNDMWYRYGDGAIYSVNPTTGLIQGIAALLAGDLAMGQPLPPAYSVYNVPLSYRDQYYDTPDAWYRYNDGYIYRVDPTTQLITAVIDAIV